MEATHFDGQLFVVDRGLERLDNLRTSNDNNNRFTSERACLRLELLLGLLERQPGYLGVPALLDLERVRCCEASEN